MSLTPTLLLILDGYGLAPAGPGNAASLARTPNIDRLISLPGATRMRAVIGNPKLWLVALCSYWLARNLPWPPFNWLAPGGFPGL